MKISNRKEFLANAITGEKDLRGDVRADLYVRPLQANPQVRPYAKNEINFKEKTACRDWK